MDRISIRDFCEKHGQQKAADIIGCSQGNVSQILNQGRREIYFEPNGKGSYTWVEIKRPKKTA